MRISRLLVCCIALSFSLALLSSGAADGAAPSGEVIYDYGDFTINGSFGSWQPGEWDMTRGPVVLSYSQDSTGAQNNAGVGWSEANVGLLWPGSGLLDSAGARMAGFLMDGDNSGVAFPAYPDRDGTIDLDDKFNLQRFPNPGVWSELEYDVLCDTNTVVSSPVGSHSSYGIWFDRDGVDPFQAQGWGAVNGGTYNTGGVYDVEITFRQASASRGTACARFAPLTPNPLDRGDPDDDVFGVPTGFDRQPGGSYADFPAGISFASDPAKMSMMRVLVQGTGGLGTFEILDLQVTGHLLPESGKELCKKGGWRNFADPSFRNQGQCVSFFARQMGGNR